jgi:hypothetical protein
MQNMPIFSRKYATNHGIIRTPKAKFQMEQSQKGLLSRSFAGNVKKGIGEFK